ncbi:hypothetical protein [Actinobaculum sp. 352]|uniref:hypothetical protein n=1 Tax=Actinobaculum sp. 352 TaxID=2490946 RepID=UPI000F7EF916|nr:hypothetical protein [Actinobaculum sp. 352]RTE48807.1 hypothetical protein EKN07_08865 [Actinobaculum sp. 352]
MTRLVMVFPVIDGSRALADLRAEALARTQAEARRRGWQVTGAGATRWEPGTRSIRAVLPVHTTDRPTGAFLEGGVAA